MCINGTKVECKEPCMNRYAFNERCINGTKVECKAGREKGTYRSVQVLMEPKWNVKQ